jgi:hypothetical protein
MSHLQMNKYLVIVGLFLVLISFAVSKQSKAPKVFHSDSDSYTSQIPAQGWITREETAVSIADAILEEMQWPLKFLPKERKIYKRDGLWIFMWLRNKSSEPDKIDTFLELDSRTGSVVRFSQTRAPIIAIVGDGKQ